MARITYIFGNSVDERHMLLEEMMSGPGSGRILHLVQTRGRVIELESETRFWLKREVNTLTGLIHQIFNEEVRHIKYKDFRQIDLYLKELLVKQVLENKASQPGELQYFNRLFRQDRQDKDFAGVYRAVARFFSILVDNNYEDIFADDLAGKIIRLEEQETGKGDQRYALESDLAWLFGDYEEIKRELKVYDEDDVISGVRGFLQEGDKPSIIEDKDVLVIDGLAHLSRIEEDIICFLTDKIDYIWWLIDYSEDESESIEAFKKVVKGEGPDHNLNEVYKIFTPVVSLMDRLEHAGHTVEIKKVREEDSISFEEIPVDRSNESTKKRIKIRSFSNKVDEIRAIAGEIKRIIHEDGLDVFSDLGKIRVIFPDLNDYSSIISEIFGEYGIPFSLTKGLPISSHPISGIVTDILTTPLNHFRLDDVFRLFGSGLIKKGICGKKVFDRDDMICLLKKFLLPEDNTSMVEALINEAKTEFDISLFKKATGICGIRSLNDDLSGISIKSLLSVRDLYQERLKNEKSRREREKIKSEYYEFIIQTAYIRRCLSPLLELTGLMNPKEISDAICSILEDLGFPENLIDTTEEVSFLSSDSLIGMIRRDIKVFFKLKDLLYASAAELRFANRLNNAGVGDELLYAFSFAFNRRLNDSYILDERNPNVVRISQWLEIRGRAFDYVFAGGLTAEKFPLKEETNFIIPESPNRMFRRLDSVEQSRYLFDHLLRNYRRSLYISYPLYSGDKELQPSQMLLDFETDGRDMISPESGASGPGKLIKWEDNPFITSKYEMLNADFDKLTPQERKSESYLSLDNIIPDSESSVIRMIRGIRAFVSRWSLDGVFEYDGMIADASRFGEYIEQVNSLFSASQLESLANCPMRFLFERVYGLRIIEEPGIEVSPKEMGLHIHNILSLFFRDLCESGKNVSDIGLDRAFLHMKRVASDYFNERKISDRIELFDSQKEELLSGLDQETKASAEEPLVREGILAMLLRFENDSFRDKLPVEVEYEFGIGDRPPAILGNIRLRGFIDRFDRDLVGGNRIHIFDYKSGTVPALNMIKKGLSFQLPVYINSLKQEFEDHAISANYYSLNRRALSSESPIKQTVSINVGLEKGLDISGVKLLDIYADNLIELLKTGAFHHSTDYTYCTYCEYRYACHKDERRMDHLIEMDAGETIYSGKRNLEKWTPVDRFRKEWKAAQASMKKATELKTESAREKHGKKVMEFKEELVQNRESLPFHKEYIDKLINKIEEFERTYK